jgi:hypothetical protein
MNHIVRSYRSGGEKIAPRQIHFANLTGERFIASVSHRFTLGIKEEFEVSQEVTRSIVPDRFITNPVEYGFVLIRDILFDKKSIQEERGVDCEDAIVFGPMYPTEKLESCPIPKRLVQKTITFRGVYTGLVLEGYTKGQPFHFIFTVSGPSVNDGVNS